MFPHMNIIRKLKAYINIYPLWKEDNEKIQDFFQFLLNEKKVIKDCIEKGFTLIDIKKRDGIIGLGIELEILKPFLKRISNSRYMFIRELINLLFNRICSHSILLICKKG